MFETIRYSVRQFLDDVKVLMANDHPPPWESVWPDYMKKDTEPHCKCEDKVKDRDYYIEEWFDKSDRKVKYSVYKILRSSTSPGKRYPYGSYDNLNEATRILRLARKYEKPIIHYY